MKRCWEAIKHEDMRYDMVKMCVQHLRMNPRSLPYISKYRASSIPSKRERHSA